MAFIRHQLENGKVYLLRNKEIGKLIVYRYALYLNDLFVFFDNKSFMAPNELSKSFEWVKHDPAYLFESKNNVT